MARLFTPQTWLIDSDELIRSLRGFRRGFRRTRRRAVPAAISIVCCLSLLATQTQAIPFLLVPQPAACLLPGSCTADPIPAAARLPGMPMAWQAAESAGPFSVVNLANGTLFSTVPIVSWSIGSGGSGVTFNLYHSPSAQAVSTIGSRWTHSYSDKLTITGSTATYYSEDGRQILFSLTGSPDWTGENKLYRLKLDYSSSTTQWTLTRVDQSKLIFDNAGVLLSAKDPNGFTTTMTYQNGVLRYVTDSVNRQLTLGNASGKLTSVTAPPLKQYTGNGQFQDVPREWALEYDPVRGFLTHVKSPRKDGYGNPLFQTSFAYTSLIFLSAVTDYRDPGDTSGNFTTNYEYASDRVTRVQHPPIWDYDYQGGQTRRAERLYAWVPGSGGAMTTTVTDERSNNWVYTFDTGGRLLTQRDPLNRTLVTLTWNKINRPCSLTNVLGGVYTFDYNETTGNVQSVTTPRSATPFNLVFTTNNYLTRVTDPLGTLTEYDYQNGTYPNVVTKINGTANSDTTLTYDSNAMLTNIAGPTGAGTGIFYDTNRNPDYTTFGPCDEHDFTFVETGEQLQSHYQRTCSISDTAPPDAFAHFPDEPEAGAGCSCPSTADASGNIGGLGPAGGGCGDCAEIPGCPEGPGGSAFAYDGNGRILSTPINTFAYDARGRETGFYQNDLASGYTSNLTLTREYSDSSGKLRVKAQHQASDSVYEYTAYILDAAGRLGTVKTGNTIDPAEIPTLTTVMTYTYSDAAAPNITEVRESSKTLITLANDGLISVIEHKKLDNSLIARYTYTRDAIGRITQIVEARPASGGGEMTATTTYAYGDGYIDPATQLDNGDNAILSSELQYSFCPTSALQHGDPNRLISERRWGSDSAMGPFFKKEYWYDPAGNRLAMRESTPAATEPQDVPTHVTRYNYWFYTYAFNAGAGNASRPATPISSAPISSGQTPRQQLVGIQRFDLASSAATGTQYQYASAFGDYNRDGITLKLVHTAAQTGGQWKATYQEKTDYAYWDFLFLKEAKQRWANYDAQLCPTLTGGFTQNYGYDYFGRLTKREGHNCGDACQEPGACTCTPPGNLPDTCAADSTTLVYYGYNGLRPEVLSERGGQRFLHATYILSNFGPGIRTDRNGSVLTLSDDTRIEPLMDAGANNAAMAKPSGGQVAVGYEQTDAFGNLINPSGALADLGSFAWRGREGTINFRFGSTSGDPGLYRMGDRAMEAATGRFTQADRLPLTGMSPLSGNRYTYAMADPVNFTDPSGYGPWGTFAFHMALQLTIIALILTVVSWWKPDPHSIAVRDGVWLSAGAFGIFSGGPVWYTACKLAK